MTSLAARIRDYKSVHAVTEAEVARRAGLKYATLHGYLAGRRIPVAKNAVKLSRLLGVSVEELVGK